MHQRTTNGEADPMAGIQSRAQDTIDLDSKTSWLLHIITPITKLGGTFGRSGYGTSDGRERLWKINLQFFLAWVVKHLFLLKLELDTSLLNKTLFITLL